MPLTRSEILTKLKGKKLGQRVWVERGVFARKAENGQIRYGISYLYGRKRRLETIGGNLADARTTLAKRKADIDRGQYKEKRKVPTFSEFGTEYLEHAKENGKTTWELDESFIERFKKHFGDHFLSDIEARDIQKYKKRRQQDQVKNTKRKVTPRTVNMELKLLRRMYNVAMKHFKYVDCNPAKDD